MNHFIELNNSEQLVILMVISEKIKKTMIKTHNIDFSCTTCYAYST